MLFCQYEQSFDPYVAVTVIGKLRLISSRDTAQWAAVRPKGAIKPPSQPLRRLDWESGSNLVCWGRLVAPREACASNLFIWICELY